MIDTWLEGQVEGSPLAIFRPVPIDESQAAGIAEDLGRWRHQEAERAKAIAAYIAAAAGHEALAVPDPRPAGEWLHTHAAALLAVSNNVLLRARSWYPYFTAKSSHRAAGAEQRRSLVILLKQLEKLSPTGRAAAFAVQVRRLDNRDLERASRTASHFQRASAFGRLNPIRMASRLAARSILRKLGLSHDDGDCIAFAEVARLERETREAALSLQNICSFFAIEESLNGADLVTLIRIGKTLARDLDCFAEVASRLDACPLSAEAWNAAFETASQAHEGRPAKAFAQFLYRMALAKAVADARIAASAAIASLEPFLAPGSMAECSGDIAADRPVRVAFAAIERALPRLVAYQTFRLRARSLSAEAQAVFRALGGMAKALRNIDASKRRDTFTALLRCEAARHWKQEIEAGSPQLLQGRQQLDERIAHLAGLDEEMRDANRKVLAHVNRDGLSGVQAWTPIWPLTGQNSKRLRQVVDQGRRLGLMKLRPIWLVNPDVVSRMFPLDAGLFDVVVFDEASQMRVANAVPALFRARRCVVSGDDKQLPPTSFFGSRIESDEDDLDDDWIDTADTGDAEAEAAEQRERQTTENRRHVKECDDLLALSRGLLPQASLDIHYRSSYRELIAFSNAAYYEGRLNIPVRRPLAEVARFKPIEVSRVDGIYRSQTNPDEAAAIVDFHERTLARASSASNGWRRDV